MTDTKATTKMRLEREYCGRCGGSGHYSRNRYGDTRCYDCGGSGTRLTKRGRAALDWMRERLATDALSVKPGDRVKYHDTLSGKVLTFTIAEVIEETPIKGRSRDPETGEWFDHEIRQVTLVTVGGKRHGFGGAIPLQRVLPEADHTALLREALDYQATLTKAGKPQACTRKSNEHP